MSQIQKELELISKRHNGVLHPEHVLAYARNHPKSALHGRFEWDDARAAERQRLQTARQIISVYVKVIDIGGEEKTVRAFFSPIPDSGPQTRGYVSTVEKMQHPGGRAEIALHVLKRMYGEYQSYPLEELEPVAQAIRKLQAELGVGQVKAEAA
jgi:hypothetical protein